MLHWTEGGGPISRLSLGLHRLSKRENWSLEGRELHDNNKHDGKVSLKSALLLD